LKQHKADRQKDWTAKKNTPLTSNTKSSSKWPEKSSLVQAGVLVRIWYLRHFIAANT
jgi:hypothetical protein